LKLVALDFVGDETSLLSTSSKKVKDDFLGRGARGAIASEPLGLSGEDKQGAESRDVRGEKDMGGSNVA
jgi:hypothetical protein